MRTRKLVAPLAAAALCFSVSVVAMEAPRAGVRRAPRPVATASSPAPVVPMHPVLGQPVRVVLHRYRPDAQRELTAPADVAVFVAALGATHQANASVPRAMPFAEVLFYGAAPTPLANALFMSATDAGYLTVTGRGTRELSAAEATALRAALARFP